MFHLEGFSYLIVFLASLPLVFQILMALNLESKFKKNQIWQIKAAYIIVTIVVSHLVAEVFIRLYFLFQ